MLTNKEGIMVLFFILIFLVLKINCQITTQLWKTRYFSQENWQNGFLKTQILLSTGDIGFMECQSHCLKKGHLCDSFHFEKLTGDCVLGQDSSSLAVPNSYSNSSLMIFVKAESIGLEIMLFLYPTQFLSWKWCSLSYTIISFQ